MTGQLADLANVDDDQAAAAAAAAEQLADLIAARVVDQLHDLRLDAPAVPLLEHARRAGSWYFRNMLAVLGPHILEASGSIHADRIELELSVDGGQRIWTATLREPD